MTQPPCPSRADLAAYHQGDLPDDGATVVHAHLERDCPRCAGVLAEFDHEADTFFGVLRGNPPPFLRGDVTTTSPAADTLPQIGGRSLAGKYDLLEEIGRGGMGVVYRAREVRLGRTVAVKMIADVAATSDVFRERFAQEAKALAGLEHPNIVRLYEYGEDERRPFVALEFVEGESLAQELRRKLPAARDAAARCAQLARGLHYAHEKGVIHRDLKPANILIARDGTAKITDFGLAKRPDVDSGQTHSNAVMGTPSYMSPEQALGQARDVRPTSDVYSLGATFYEMLTGRPPFQGPAPLDVLEQVRHREPIRPSRLQPKVPRELDTICLKCLAKEPGRRYATAGELADDLERFLNDQPIHARPAGWLERGVKWSRRHPAGAALIAVLAASLLVLLWGLLEIAASRDGAIEEGKKAEQERDAARRARDDAQGATADALRHRRVAEGTVLDLHVASGLMADQRGDLPQAALWFAHAARLPGSTPEQRAINRVRVQTWSRAFPNTVRALPHPKQRLHELLFHRDGKHLLVCAGGARVTLWDLEREQALPLPGGDRRVSSAVYSPDGRRLVLGTPDGAVAVYRFPGGDEAALFRHDGPITRLACSDDGRYLAVAGKSLRIWDSVSGKFLPGEAAHPRAVGRMAFNHKGNRVVTGAEDQRARVFAIEDGALRGAPLYTLPHRMRDPDHDWMPMQPLFIDNDRGLLTLERDDRVCWSHAETGKRLVPAFPEFPCESVSHVVPSPDGRSFVVCYFRGAEIWDVATRRPYPIELRHTNFVVEAAFSPDGRHLLTVSGDRTARLWATASGEPASCPLLLDQLEHCAFSPAGGVFATSQDGGMVRVWKMDNHDPHDSRLPTDSPWTFATLSPDGRNLLATGTHRLSNNRLGELRVHELATGKPLGKAMTPGGRITAATFTPDGRHVLAARTGTGPTPAQRLEFWDWEKGTRVRDALLLHSMPVAVACNPAAPQAAVVGANGEIVVFDTDSGVVRHRLVHGGDAPLHHFVPAARACYTSDGRKLVTWGLGQAVRVWDPATGAEPYPALVHEAGCFNAALSPDERQLVTASEDKQARVWDVETGELLTQLPAHPDWVFNARFTPDGEHVLTACRDGNARLWDLRTGKLVCRPMRHEDEVFDVACSPDGRWLFTASKDSTARVWERATGKPVTPGRPLSGWGFQLSVSADGQRVVAAGEFSSPLVMCLDDLRGSRVDPLDADALVQFAEIQSGQRLHEDGGVENLTADEWHQRWRQFRATHPRFHNPGTSSE